MNTKGNTIKKVTDSLNVHLQAFAQDENISLAFWDVKNSISLYRIFDFFEDKPTPALVGWLGMSPKTCYYAQGIQKHTMVVRVLTKVVIGKVPREVNKQHQQLYFVQKYGLKIQERASSLQL
jgi:hypothetical protein